MFLTYFTNFTNFTKSKNPFSLLTIISLISLFLTFLYATFSFQALHSEEVTVFYSLIEERWFQLEYGFFRFFNFVLQAPTVFLSRLLPTQDLSIKLLKYLHSFLYAFYPWISLASCFYLLKKVGRLSLMIFPLFTFLLVLETSITSTFVKAPQAVLLFWPCFLLCFFFSASFKRNLLIILLNICLALSYEMAFLLLGFNLIILLGKLVKKQRSWIEEWPVLTSLLLALSILFYFFAVFWVPRPGHFSGIYQSLLVEFELSQYYRHFLSPDTNYLYYGNCLYLLFVIYLIFLFSTFQSKWKFNLFFLLPLSSVVIFFYLWKLNPSSALDGVYYGRVLMIPKTLLLACFALLLPEEKLRTPHAMAFTLPFSLLCLIMAISHNIASTKAYSEGDKIIQVLGKKNPGCFFLPVETFGKFFFFKGLYHHTIFHQSVIVQEKKVLDYVIFQGSEFFKGYNVDPCKNFHNNRFISIKDDKIPYFIFIDLPRPPLKSSSFFDFSRITTSLKIHHHPLPTWKTYFGHYLEDGKEPHRLLHTLGRKRPHKIY